MMISGDKAALYRTSMVKILSRYYAGDDSLTEEIQANAQSAAPIAQMARESLAEDVTVPDALSLQHKRKREELELSKLQIEIDCMRGEHLIKLANSYRELCQDTVMDERARLIFKDNFLNMAMLQGPSPGNQALLTNGQPSNNKPISLSLVAIEMGMKIPSN